LLFSTSFLKPLKVIIKIFRNLQIDIKKFKFELTFNFFHLTPSFGLHMFFNKISNEKTAKQGAAWFKSQISMPKVQNIWC
jgi:hypothetical protein